MPDLKITKRDPVTGRLTLGISRPPEQIEGIDLLVQIVAVLLLTNGGRSITTPDRSGGFRSLIGSNYIVDDASELFADVRMILNRVEQTVKEEQAAVRRPPSESLHSLHLIDIVPDEENLEIEVIVSVINVERQQAQVLVGV